jgi:RHS repeat-associated protein
MSKQSDATNQIIDTPKGGGAFNGIGEKFSADLYTGTGTFTIPIALPAGRNGFRPALSLDYSAGNGNGPFGLGWSLSVPGVSRKTSKGIPRYDDSEDVFLLTGVEDLVPTETRPGATVYRPRTEGLFARITHFSDPSNDYWEVRSKDGLVSLYGTPGKVSSDPNLILDPAALADPQNSRHVFAWKLTLTRDPFGNRIEYGYVRDLGSGAPHVCDQLYLSEVRYADYGDPQNRQFLAKLRLTYDGPVWRPGQSSLPPVSRLDAFSSYRSGFEIRTTKRCTQLDVFTPGETLARSYHLLYQDQSGTPPLNGTSLLAEVVLEGRDGPQSELLPPLEFSYTDFQPAERTFRTLTGADLPPQSLADPGTDLVDLFGQGLPDVLEMNGTVRYWRNRGNGSFDLPRAMSTAPAGVGLADPGVQIIDANGDGVADLLVTTATLNGYFPMRFGGLWDGRGFAPYRVAPSFNLKDPEVRFVDLDGDGVTDAIRSGTSLECYFNDAVAGWTRSLRVPRKSELDAFPDVDFADPRVKWADMTGDGLQDIVLVYDGVVQYWPNLGYGAWGRRITMVDERSLPGSRPHFPYGYDPKRILVGDVDGDGAADLVYVDDRRVTLWLNQSGNRWSEPIMIQGTPPVSDTDSIRLADLLGSGTVGVLWTSNLTEVGRPHMFFLDLTGGTKPYLLRAMNNHLGSVTKVTYRPSTYFYLRDEQTFAARWITPLPFPVQVVACVETSDAFSGGRLTTEYNYHHGYWDGYEREFRGFGRVDQRDTEIFAASSIVPPQSFSPPTETRTWFHQGAIGDRFSSWFESDTEASDPLAKRFTDEYYVEPWPGVSPSSQILSRPAAMKTYLGGLAPSIQRDAYRSMRGKVLRTELYGLDGSARASAPYTVTEHVYGVREASPPSAQNPERPRVFFPFLLSERTTEWERGVDPQTVATFTDECSLSHGTLTTADYDAYGQPLARIGVAIPRSRVFQNPTAPCEPYLTSTLAITYAQRDDAQAYLVDCVSANTTYEVPNDGSLALREFVSQIQSGGFSLSVVSQTLRFYDGAAYVGLPFGQLGLFGAVTRTENLAFTDAILQSAYGANVPPYLSPSGIVQWPPEYPAEFQNELPPLAGYHYETGEGGYLQGYYQTVESHQYDFQQVPLGPIRGLLTGKKDALAKETAIAYDAYQLLPAMVTDAAGLHSQASYDYRVFAPSFVADANGNQTSYSYRPLGLLETILVMGQAGQNLGDTSAQPGTQFTYTFMGVGASGLPVPIADLGQPISVTTVRRTHHVSETDVPESERDQTIQTVAYSDGFGRVLQTRTHAEDVLFDSSSPGNPLFGDAGLPADQSQPGGDAQGVPSPIEQPFVVVSGWQLYDNKGQVVEKYEPFFSTGWGYAEPADAQLGQRLILYYDPRGRVTRTVHPDSSEQRAVFGVPGTIAVPDLSNPDVFEPTPWETYTYDEDDNAGRTNPTTSTAFQHCWNTPSSIVVDALGRTIQATERNRDPHAGGSWSAIVPYTTVSTYDIVGNLLTRCDPLGRAAFTYIYDLLKRSLSTTTLDAGMRMRVPDAVGNLVEHRDSKGSLSLHLYEAIQRATRLWARDTIGQPVTLREKIIYGDDLANSGFTLQQALAANLLGKPYQHYDEAGLLTFVSYDFKGNLLDKTRNVITEAALLSPFLSISPNGVVTPFRVDWGSADLSFLDTSTTYETTTAYDAFNRVKTLLYPQDVTGSRKLLSPRYNHAGALEHVDMDGTTYVDRIAYNAKGQRILLTLGNAWMTRYAYDPKTFRLLRLRTEQYTIASGTVDYHPSAAGSPLQDFGYEHDLVGNILALHDRTPGSGIVNSVTGEDALDRAFVYDPIFRLVSATGRECDVPPPPPPWTDVPRCTDLLRTRSYVERYQYDTVGNMAVLQHASVDSSGNPGGYTRTFFLAAANNQLAELSLDPTTTYQYTYDPNGNLSQENTERHFEWDQSDRLRVFRVQPDGAPPSTYTQYLYSSTGQRIMKLVRHQNGSYEATVYIDGVFEFAKAADASGNTTTLNNSLHVMDNQKRISLVRLGPGFPDDGSPATKYYFADHLESSNVVVDDSGSFVNREEYLPYGESSFGSFARKRYRYTGKERDAESGLSYHVARYYAPWLTRWISGDPSATRSGKAPPVGGSSNGMFSYCKLNPMIHGDADGAKERVFYITLESGFFRDNDYLKSTGDYGKQVAASGNVTHLHVENIDDMVRQLRKELKPGDTVRSLTIASHGNPQGGVLMPTDKITEYQSPETLAVAAARLRGSGLREIQAASADATVTLHACYVGEHKDALKQWGRFFGGKNVTVEAPTVYINFYKRDDGTIKLYLDKNLETGGQLKTAVPLEGKEGQKLMGRVIVNERPLGDPKDAPESSTTARPDSPDPPTSRTTSPTPGFEGNDPDFEAGRRPDAGRYQMNQEH